jgi:hypothetical protein
MTSLCEPWATAHDGRSVTIRDATDEVVLTLTCADERAAGRLVRAADCVTGCAGVRNPRATIPALRTALIRLRDGEDLCGHADLLSALMRLLDDLGTGPQLLPDERGRSHSTTTAGEQSPAT